LVMRKMWRCRLNLQNWGSPISVDEDSCLQDMTFCWLSGSWCFKHTVNCETALYSRTSECIEKVTFTHTWFDALASGCSIVICLKCSFLGLHEKVNHVRSHNASLLPSWHGVMYQWPEEVYHRAWHEFNVQ